jgi:post-segregation antitoxin (ccd killing protein)
MSILSLKMMCLSVSAHDSEVILLENRKEKSSAWEAETKEK